MTSFFALLSALQLLRRSMKVEVDVPSSRSKPLMVYVRGIQIAEGFGGSLGTKAIAAHRELSIPSALLYTRL
jgi:hypothetical protein